MCPAVGSAAPDAKGAAEDFAVWEPHPVPSVDYAAADQKSVEMRGPIGTLVLSGYRVGRFLWSIRAVLWSKWDVQEQNVKQSGPNEAPLLSGIELTDASGKAPLGLGPLSMRIWHARAPFLILILLAFIGLDQVTKVWAQGALAEPRQVIERINEDGNLSEREVTRFVAKRPPMVVIPYCFNFRYAENRAAAFSLTRSFPDWFRMPFLITFSALAMLIVALWYFRMDKPDGILLSALALIEAGAVGNLIDRVRLGYVIDFIDWYAGFINPNWPSWPTFNIADSCIVVGAILVIYRTFRPLYEAEEMTDSPDAPKS